MDGPKILEAAEYHSSFLSHIGVVPARADQDLLDPRNQQAFAHLLWMTGEVPHLVATGHEAKAMRWVCFAQGVLWKAGLATVRSLKNVNRDTAIPYDPAA